MVKAFFDGSAKPNPGIMTIGGIILNEKGSIIHEFSVHLGHGTNNEAEYNALLFLLSRLQIHKIDEVEIFGDSNLVVNQVNENWKIKVPNLRILKDRCKDEMKKFKFITLTHIFRKENFLADQLTRK
jgi:ribonuclease HI